jgi:nucleoside-diphosphate-sugar epimerase
LTDGDSVTPCPFHPKAELEKINFAMNILITGANGFIGQALYKRMLADGYQVRGAVRSAAQITALPSGIEGAMVGDIGPETDWSEALDGIEGIVHLAARVHVMRESAVDPLAAFREVNVEGTKCLAIAAADAGVKRFVYISSVKVNGESTGDMGQGAGNRKHGIGSRRSVPKESFSEKDIPEPRDPYGISKLEAEQVLRNVAADTGMEVVVLRPPIVYGPGVKANFLRLLQIVWMGIPLPLANINNCRSFIFLGNFIDAIITCIEQRKAVGQTYFVSDGEDVSTPELIRRIAYSMGRPARLYFFPTSIIQLFAGLSGKSVMVDRLVSSFTVNISKIKRDLNWNPPYTMDEGLKETAEWYTKKLVNC